MTYRLDRWAHRLDEGRVLIGGSPPRLFRLGPRGVAAVDAVAQGEPPPAGAAPLVDRLVRGGAVHPWPDEHADPTFGPADVTVVVPVRDRDPGRTLAGLTGVGRVLVVDDGSVVPVPERDGVDLVTRPIASGPAAARNEGLARVSTPIVAFVDSDVTVAEGWLGLLLAHFADVRVGIVAPRVRARGGGPVVGAYEAVRSPLDLGPEPAEVRPAGRVAYLPAAAIVARVDALREVGGFDESLATGEDVDLVWRLVAAGWRGRYEPRVEVKHDTRSSVRALARQRASYGRAAAPLGRRHGDAVAPARLTPAGAAVVATTALGQPLLAVLPAMVPAVGLARRTGLPLAVAVRMALAGARSALEQAATATTRPWLPLALLAAMVSRRARRWLAAAVVVPAAIEWWKQRPAVDPVRFTALRAVDDAAYGIGVAQGCLSERTARPLLPVIVRTEHPPRRSARRAEKPE